MYMYILFQIWTLFNYNNYRFITEYVSFKNNTIVLGFRLLLGFFGFQLVLRFGLVLGLVKVGVWVRILGFLGFRVCHFLSTGVRSPSAIPTNLDNAKIYSTSLNTIKANALTGNLSGVKLLIIFYLHFLEIGR
jgi:hypothetical protein